MITNSKLKCQCVEYNGRLLLNDFRLNYLITNWLIISKRKLLIQEEMVFVLITGTVCVLCVNILSIKLCFSCVTGIKCCLVYFFGLIDKCNCSVSNQHSASNRKDIFIWSLAISLKTLSGMLCIIVMTNVSGASCQYRSRWYQQPVWTWTCSVRCQSPAPAKSGIRKVWHTGQLPVPVDRY